MCISVPTKIRIKCWQDTEERLSEEEARCDVIDADKRKAEAQCGALKDELESLEASIHKLEEEKKGKDVQIKVISLYFPVVFTVRKISVRRDCSCSFFASAESQWRSDASRWLDCETESRKENGWRSATADIGWPSERRRQSKSFDEGQEQTWASHWWRKCIVLCS